MSARAMQLANLRVWLAAVPTSDLGEYLSAMRDELSTRLNFDAANYVTRAIASLDVVKVGSRAIPATAEPPSSS
jgi:hypothetical protein